MVNLLKCGWIGPLINDMWQEVRPNSLGLNGTVLGSDHCPLIVQSEVEGPRIKRMFKFEAFWAVEAECKEVVRSCWERRELGWISSRWRKKNNDCKSSLIKWSRNKFHKRGQQIHELLQELDVLQKEWVSNIPEIKEKSRAQEESFWLQRSRLSWLRAGDANTKFFHQSTLYRRRRNKVIKINDGEGMWEDRPGRVRNLMEEHFISTFTSEGPREWGSILDYINRCVSEEMNMDLLRPITAEEVKLAAYKMGGLKAPGPDGFQGIFYHSFWDVVHEDVNRLVSSLLQGSVSPCSLNATHIVLIPKVPNPESASHFRPISLCNYSYKILSKVLANRLKVFLPNIISPSQNAFVAGRQIQDNIGVAHEMFHFLKGRKAKGKFEMGIKLDMQKAYDRVEWDFLDAIMEKNGI